MLDAHRKQSFRRERIRPAFGVLGAHRNVLGAPYFFVYVRHRQAAFFPVGLAAGGKQFRVDEHLQLVAGFRDIDDDDAQMHVYLCCGQANAGRGIHGFRHVFD
ncbi:hypothetical protein D3C83_11150 [compost metagenome]